MRRLTAAIAAAVLVLFGSVVLAGAASADPATVTITSPSEDGEDTTPLVAGTSTTALPIHLLVNDVEVSTVTPAQDGSWSYQLTDALKQGEQAAIVARLLDDQQNVLSESAYYYYVLPAIPTVTITEPTNGAVIGHSFTVRATAPDGGGQYNLLLDGKVIDKNLGYEDQNVLFTTPYVEGLTDGPHTLQIRAKDSFGRAFESPAVQVVGDVTPPPPAVLTSPAPGSTVTTTTFVFKGTGTSGDKIVIVYPRSGEPVSEDTVVRPDGTWSAPVRTYPMEPHNPLEWSNDPYRTLNLLLEATDPAGNRSQAAFVLTLDRRTPSTPAAPKPAAVKPPADRPAGSAVPAVAAADDPAAAPPALANTGSSTLPGTATGLLLLALGLGLTGAARRFAPARR